MKTETRVPSRYGVPYLRSETGTIMFFGTQILRNQIGSYEPKLALLFEPIGFSFYGEFDPGSGRTLAACLIHASRANSWIKLALSLG